MKVYPYPGYHLPEFSSTSRYFLYMKMGFIIFVLENPPKKKNIYIYIYILQNNPHISRKKIKSSLYEINLI